MLHMPAWLLEQLHRLFTPEDPAAIQAKVVIFPDPDTTLYVAADGEGAHYNEEGVPLSLFHSRILCCTVTVRPRSGRLRPRTWPRPK